MDIKWSAWRKAVLIGVIVSVVLTAVPGIFQIMTLAEGVDTVPVDSFLARFSIMATFLNIIVPAVYGIIYVVFGRQEQEEFETFGFEDGMLGGVVTGAAVRFLGGIVASIITFSITSSYLPDISVALGYGAATYIAGFVITTIFIGTFIGAFVAGIGGGIFASLQNRMAGV